MNKLEREEIEKRNKVKMSDKEWQEYSESKEYNGSEKFGIGHKDIIPPPIIDV